MSYVVVPVVVFVVVGLFQVPYFFLFFENIHAYYESVSQHYDNIVEQDSETRTKSPLFQLRAINNTIKALLISQSQSLPSPSSSSSTTTKPRAILDLACGKAGDIHKWKHAAFQLYVGIDISAANITCAKVRAQTVHGCHHNFYVLNLAMQPLPPLCTGLRFQSVACMFALHYFWYSEQAMRNLLETIWQNLENNGTFLGIIPDADAIHQHANSTWGDCEIGPIQDNGSYTFTLGDRVQQCTEYLVPIQQLTAIAYDFELQLELFQNCQQFLLGQDDVSINMLLQKMQAGTTITGIRETHWNTVGLYSVFIFRKRAN